MPRSYEVADTNAAMSRRGGAPNIRRYSYPGSAVYGGTKWFVRDFMEVLRIESAMEGTNIRAATIYPAAINTELLGAITHKETAAGMAELYEQYGISPDRIANVVAFAIDQPDDTTINEFNHSVSDPAGSIRIQATRIRGVAWGSGSGSKRRRQVQVQVQRLQSELGTAGTLRGQAADQKPESDEMRRRSIKT
jgi:hypothetical protein